MTAHALRRRYAILSAVVFTSTGLRLPVTVVLMRERGLSFGGIGIVTATMAAVVLVLELPTGGLADALGRRPVLLAAGALDLAALAIFVIARSPVAFMVAWGVEGASRALESGPLDSWYVDAAVAQDVQADIERGLSWSNVALSLAVALSGLAVAGLVSLPSIGGLDPLVLPVLAAIVARLAAIVAVAVVVREPRRHHGRGATLAGVLAAPRVVRNTLGIVRRSPAQRSLASVELLWGAGLVGVELLAGPRLSDLMGGERQGVAAYGLAIAAGWTLSAVGAAAAGRLTARLGSPARAGAVLRIAQGGAALAMAAVAGPAGLLVGYLAFYLVHGPSNVVHYGLVHRLTDSEHRTAMVSVNSLTSRVGGLVGSLALGAIAQSAGIPASWVGSAILLAVAAPLYRIAGRGRTVTGVVAGRVSGPAQRDDGRLVESPSR